jgi:hypothetical protein
LGNDKVLTWRFPNARAYRVTLRVKGLQGTANSSTVLVSVKGKDAFTAEVNGPEGVAQPGDSVTFNARTSLPSKHFNWFVNGALVGTKPDLIWSSKEEGEFQTQLVAQSEDGRSATNSRVFSVKENPLTARITDIIQIPLRDRRQDFQFILDCLLQNPDINPDSEDSRSITEIGNGAYAAIEDHVFKGNFRELENTLRAACLRASGEDRGYIYQADLSITCRSRQKVKLQ